MNKQTDVKSGEFRAGSQAATEKVELHEITTAQRELWLGENISKDLSFNIWGYGQVDGPLNVKLLRQAIDAIVEETPALQAHFVEKDGELYQYRAPRTHEPLFTLDLSKEPDPLQAARRWMVADSALPRRATGEEPFSFYVITLAPQRYILYRRFHHMITDGRSAEEVMRRIAAYYNALASGGVIPEFANCNFSLLYENDIKYRDSSRFSSDQAFWREYTAAAPQSLSRRAVLTPDAAMHHNTQLLEKDVLDRLQRQADNIGVHRAHILAAAVALCFYSLTGSEYLNFSMPVTGTRERNSIGMTSNVVPLIIKVEPQLSLAEFIQKVAAEIAKVVRHQLYRGEDIRRDNGATDSAWFGPSINIVSFDHGDPFWGCRTRWYYGGNIPSGDLQIMLYEDQQANELDVTFSDAAYANSLDDLDVLQRRFQFILRALNASTTGTIEALDRQVATLADAGAGGSFYANRRQPPAGGIIRWDRPAQALQRLVSSLSHGAGCAAKILLAERVLGVTTLLAVSDERQAEPGTLLRIETDGWEIAAHPGVVRVGPFLRADGSIQPGDALAQACGLSVGSVLPTLSDAEASLLGAAYGASADSAAFWQPRLTRFYPAPFPPGPDRRAALPARWQATAWQRLEKIAGEQVLAAATLYLARMCNETDFQLGWITSNDRDWGRWAHLSARVLPLQVSVDHSYNFQQALAALEQEYGRLRAHADYHPALLTGDADLRAPQAWPTAVSIVSRRSETGLQPEDEGVAAIMASGSRAVLQICKADGAFRWVYDAASVADEQMLRATQHLLMLLNDAVRAGSHRRTIGELNLVSEEERTQLLQSLNHTVASHSPAACLHRLFEAQVKRTPDATAMTYGDDSLTYAELNTWANRWAHRLVELGVQPDSLVALCAGRGLPMLAGLLGILKAGGAYVPLDPAYSGERLQYILADSAPVLLLADELGRQALGGCEVPVLALEQPLTGNSDDLQDVEVRPSHLAYVIYTSGSTGKPKGVMVEHRQVARLFSATNAWFNFSAADKWCLFHSFAFDFSVWEIWGAWLYGGQLFIVPQEIARSAPDFYHFVCRSGITVLNQTPSAFKAFIQAQAHSEARHQLREIVFGGEMLKPSDLAPWFARPENRQTRLVNMYGITETTVHVTYRPLSAQDTAIVASPIGCRIPDLRLYLLGGDGEPVPMGAIGELYVGGEGVARGYLNRPELTAERFLEDPFNRAPGARMYRTGDLARYLPGGDIEYLGRNDQQVKIRGFRIECGEVEAQLSADPRVRSVAVDAIDDGDGNKRLVAWVVPAPETERATLATELRRHLQARLPDYMVPAAYVWLEALPLTGNGKLDKRALPVPQVDACAREAYAPPQGEAENLLAAIWHELLGVERIGRYDHFFELGGHSLMAVRLANRVQQAGWQLPLQALFASPVLHVLAQALQVAPTQESIPMLPVARDGELPLSFAQQRLWFLTQLEGMSETYHIPLALRLRGRLDRQALQQGLDALYARHESLRSRFITREDRPQVQILPANGLPLAFHDLRRHPAQAETLCRQAATQSFDLTQGPLVRAALLRLADEEHLFLLTCHHIVSDGWSTGILLRELGALYGAFRRGEADPLPPPTLQYPDYAAWQRRYLTPERLAAQAQYWRETLSDAPALLTLPTDRPRPTVQSFSGAEVPIAIDAELTQALRQFSRQHGGTLFMTVLAAWSLVLARMAGQQELVIGTPEANRGRLETESLVGFFVSTLALRIDLRDDPDLPTLLERVRHTVLAAQENRDLPFEQVVELVNPPRHLGYTPLFQVMLAWQDGSVRDIPLPGLQAELAGLEYSAAKFDLTLDLADTGEGISGTLNFATALFDRATAERYGVYLVQALRAMTLNNPRSVSHIDLLPLAEREHLLHGWNRTERDYPLDQTLAALFERQVRRTPDAIALVSGAESLSYARLNARANRLAHALIARGVGPDSRVAVCAERGLNMVTALFGILKAGGAYVPLDPAYPGERLQYILQDADPVLLLADAAGRAALGEPATPQLALEAALPETLSAENPAPRAQASHLAYVIYTSGSTGKPKGAMNEHCGVVNRLVWMQEAYGLTAADTVLQKTPFGFDVSVWEFFWPLMVGARLVMAKPEGHKDPDYLSRAIEQYGVTTLHFVPSMLQSFLADEQAATRCGNVVRVMCSGEALPAALVAEFYRRLPQAELYNLYGPTEAAVDVTAWHCSREADRVSVPIGRPIANTRIYLLDEHGQPVPLGAVGELYIGGVQVARGYLNRPDLTAERFLSDPFAPGGRMYRTGDVARYLANGDIEYLGRNDQQVKIRGFRIECGEIEATLATHPAVREAVVDARAVGDDKRLVAWVVPAADVAEETLAGALRQHVSAVLPDYMVPSAWVVVAALPLSPNGKLDRRALPEPQGIQSQAAYEAPQGERETLLAEIWRELLNVERVGRHDNFFELGGHSLLAVRLTNRLQQMEWQLPLQTLFANPTLHVVAQQLQRTSEALPPIEALPRDAALPLSFAQQRLWFLTQLEGMSETYHIPLALSLRGELDLPAWRQSLDALYARHEALRSRFITVEGQPQTHILPADALPLTVHDLRGQQDTQSRARQLAQHLAEAPFELSSGPLVRAALLRLADEEHLFLLTCHHIVSDGWSTGILLRELGVLYGAFRRGEADPLPPPTLQYPDYAAWQRRYLTPERLAAQAQYWRETLSDAPALLTLPTDRPRPTVQSFSGAEVPIAIDAELTQALRQFSRQHGGTLFMTVLAAWSLVLARMAGQQELVIGTPEANRSRLETESLVGFFVSTLALRIDLRDDPDLPTLLERIRHTVLAAQENRDLPFEQVVELVNPPRHLGYTPLFQVMLAWQDGSVRNIPLPGLQAESAELGYRIAKYDLTLDLADTGEGISGTLNFATALFDRATAERYGAYLVQVLRAMATNASQSASHIDLLPAAERELLLYGWNRTAEAYPAQNPVHAQFEQWARRTPDAIALVNEADSLSYAQLNARANQLAHQLIGQGVRPGDRVATSLERSFSLVIAQLAILKAGAAYVPLDPHLPVARQAWIIGDSGTTLILCDRDLDREIAGEIECLRIDRLRQDPTHDPAVARAGDAPAYIMYTSGSTGTPKGVMVTHQGILRLAINNRFAAFERGDRFAFAANPAFDASTLEMWGALLNGASLAIIAPEVLTDADALAAALVRQEINVLFLTTSLFNQYVHSIAATLAQLKYLISGGEAADPHAFARMLKEAGPVRLVNAYGPTEGTVIATAAIVEQVGPWQRLPIGRPIGNTHIYLLDEHLQPVPLGATGELYIGGAGVALGYLNRAELTAERFLADPFNPGDRIYRTGDLARYLPDGNIDYQGRNDRQVKIRGFRIECGEIEARVAGHPAVREAVVDVLGEANNKRLVAWVVPEAEADRQTLAVTLRQYLAGMLPEFMLPTAWVALDTLPLTPNGKLDRRALPEPQEDAYVREVYAEPEGELETLLAGIWRELLGIERVGRHDNFFELGGHSLLAVKLMAQLRRVGLSAGVQTLFTAPTLSTLAQTLVTQQEVSVPANGIQPGCASITPEMLPLAALSQAEIDAVVAQVPGGVANVQDIYALSPLQEGILFHHLLAEQGDPYQLSAVLRFDSRARLDAWLAAMQQVIDRHDILRTAFITQGVSSPVQVVWRKAELSLQELRLDPAQGDIGSRLTALFDPRRVRPDLTRAPLLSFVAAREEEGSWCVLQQWHHLIGDHSTLAVMQEEINLILAGRGDELAKAPPFRNAVAQARLGVSNAEHEQFFRTLLADIDEPSLPFGLSDVHGEGRDISTAHLALPHALNQQLRRQARRMGVSLASLCHLAWAQVLARATGRDEVVFGTVLLGRMQAGDGAERALGLFINTLPLRLDVNEVGAESAALQAHIRLSGLLAHEHAPLALAQRCSGVAAGTPLFSALLNYRHNSGEETALPAGVTLLDSQERTNYPFVLSVEDGGDSLGLTAQVRQPIEAQRVCGYMAQALSALAQALEEAPQTPICELDVMPDEEYALQLCSWNHTTEPYPADTCVHELFEQQAQLTPQAVAVIQGARQLSYAQLNARANRLAHRLIERGVQPGDRVAVRLTRSIELVCAQLAIVKAGAAYVPLDPQLPTARQAWIVNDSGACLMLAETAGNEGIPQLPVEDCEGNDGNPALRLSSGTTAYIMYTSGSTGTPKGVMTPHQGITRLVRNNRYAAFDAEDRVAFAANPAFDASTMEVWAALLNGGALVVIAPEVMMEAERLAAELQRHRITTLFLTTALFNQYVHSISGALAQLKYLISGGEKEDPGAYARLLQEQGPVQLIHAYGPTETTTFATTARIERAEGEARLPIGKPIGNTRTYLLDARGRPVPMGAIGELHIGGVGVALGYLNRPELTAQRFLSDPFNPVGGGRMYRTGDLARYLPDGCLEYQGRCDQQVKLRGFRIEPGEIEVQLAASPWVREAVVQVCSTEHHPRLVAWIVPAAEGERSALQGQLRAYLSERLPEYMVPSAYVWLDALPLTANGKLDRRALPEPECAAVGAREYAAPQGETETTLARAWCELLEIGQIGRHDNFFELGGHSLLAVRLSSQLRQQGITLPVQAIFNHPILAELAERIDRRTAEAPLCKAVPARSSGSRPPLFFVPTGFGDHSYVFELAKEIDESFPVYAVPWPAVEEKPATMSDMAASAVALIREVQPQGPYHLAGYSSGGVLAYAIAEQLQSSGEAVAFLGLIDTLRPVEAMHSPVQLLLNWVESTQERPDPQFCQQLAELPLPEAIAAVQRAGIKTQRAEVADEAALWQQRHHYAKLVEATQVQPASLKIHLFKAKQEQVSANSQNEQFQAYWQKIKQAGYCREDASALGWDRLLPPATVRVSQVNGDHVSMMEHPVHRRELGQHFNLALRDLGQA
ncbi:amino acid adenylation domain-containing protein [Serratia sp. IR-2025]